MIEVWRIFGFKNNSNIFLIFTKDINMIFKIRSNLFDRKLNSIFENVQCNNVLYSQ
jgi:hypothetical protein